MELFKECSRFNKRYCLLTEFINHNVDYQVSNVGQVKIIFLVADMIWTDNEVSFSPQHYLVAGIRITDIIIHLLNENASPEKHSS